MFTYVYIYIISIMFNQYYHHILWPAQVNRTATALLSFCYGLLFQRHSGQCGEDLRLARPFDSQSLTKIICCV